MSREPLARPPEQDLSQSTPVARAVASGLLRDHKSLPAWMFYDATGSSLYERITTLPEYYLTRAERAIFEQRSDDIVAAALGTSEAPLQVIELGAGTATKSQLLLRAVVRSQGGCRFMPIDVSHSALQSAVERLAREEPAVKVTPKVAYHEQAFPDIRLLGPRQLVLFIGSSIGNYDAETARTLLRGVRGCLLEGGALLLGTDLWKSPAILVPAYDDAQGVTAAFNMNLLVRINRELEADFNLNQFKHVALWNEQDSRIEMHLESLTAQRVHVRALDAEVSFFRGERIHTESSVKYRLSDVEALLQASGFSLERTFFDPKELFAVHLARAD